MNRVYNSHYLQQARKINTGNVEKSITPHCTQLCLWTKLHRRPFLSNPTIENIAGRLVALALPPPLLTEVKWMNSIPGYMTVVLNRTTGVLLSDRTVENIAGRLVALALPLPLLTEVKRMSSIYLATRRRYWIAPQVYCWVIALLRTLHGGWLLLLYLQHSWLRSSEWALYLVTRRRYSITPQVYCWVIALLRTLQGG